MTTDSEPWDLAGRLSVLGEADSVRLVESTPIGRIGFVVDGAPIVLPVNFVWHDGGVVFRTLEGQKLAAAAAEQAVCFEVDDWSHDEQTGWSVVITGTAREVTDWAEIEQLERLGLVPWVKGEWRPLWIRVEPGEISGRSLS